MSYPDQGQVWSAIAKNSHRLRIMLQRGQEGMDASKVPVFSLLPELCFDLLRCFPHIFESSVLEATGIVLGDGAVESGECMFDFRESAGRLGCQRSRHFSGVGSREEPLGGVCTLPDLDASNVHENNYVERSSKQCRMR